jgi:SAM-dependent methyltransferase
MHHVISPMASAPLRRQQQLELVRRHSHLLLHGRACKRCHAQAAAFAGPAFTAGGLCVHPLTTSDSAFSARAGSGVAERLHFDRFHVLSCDTGAHCCAGSTTAFFGFIASIYGGIIDEERNLGNIRQLMSRTLTELPTEPAPRLLDYGCGTGLSLGVARELNVELFGTDASRAMREQARARGLNCLSPRTVARMAPNSFDGAFASYVVHLMDTFEPLVGVWRLLKPGAVLACNHHKGTNVPELVAFIAALGGTSRIVDSASTYGSVTEHRKSS